MSTVLSPMSACKVYTPAKLAEAMVAAIGDSSKTSWLEPSCGTGVFIRAIRDRFGESPEIVGVDLDRKRAASDSLGTVCRNEEFLAWSCRTPRRFDYVIGNPPYIAIKNLRSALRSTAAGVKNLDNSPIGLRANTWYAFLLQAFRLLNAGGHMAFVLPSAAEYADYSKGGRSILTRQFKRVDLIRSTTPLFESVQEGTVVLVCTSKGETDGHFRRHVVNGIDETIERLFQLRKVRARHCPRPVANETQKAIALSDVMEISLGGVTGDSNYFVISDGKRKSLGLPKTAVVPVVSKSRHVAFAMLTEQNWGQLSLAGERIWLFRPAGKALKHPSVASYLQLPAVEGGCDRERYKIQKRSPWHVTPLPNRIDGFITGMSGRGAWICFNETEDVSATNTLYVVGFRQAMLRRERYAWGLSLLTGPVQKQIRRMTRRYADGLKKLEPGQLSRLLVPRPPRIDNAVSIYRDAVSHLLSGDAKGARALADKWVLRRSD